MQHITFARFPDSDSAVAPLERLRAAVGSAEVLVHSGVRNAADFAQQVEHSPTFETDQRRALVLGALLGLATGAAFGVVLTLIEIFPGTPLLGAMFGALMGVGVGLVMMAIIGAGLMDRRLLRLTRSLRPGEIVVTVRTGDRDTTATVMRILEEAGAQVAAKTAV